MRPLPLLLCLLASAALATPPSVEEAPTRGLYHPGLGVAGDAEPFAVGTNPASLGDLRALTLGLRHTELLGAAPFAPAGTGTGLYAAAPLPYLGFLQLGGAVEVLRPPAGPHAKLTLALGLRPLPFLSLGLGYGHLLAGPDHPFRAVNSLAVGLRLRAGAWLALGAVVHDLNAPATADPASPLQRVYEAELLGRPLGDERLEVGLGARLGEQRRDMAPRLRLWVRPRPGVGIGAEATVLAEGGRYDFRAAAGLSIDLAHAGGSLFGMVASGDGGLGAGGGSLGLRASVERYPSLPLGRGATRLIKFEPAKLTGVAFLKLLAELRRLERDRDHNGVVLVLGDLEVGWGRAEELRGALLRLRRAGRRVFVYGAELSTKAYHVATAADRIYLDPAGSLRLLGVASTGWNVKEALDLVGVRADLLRVGAYKSAPETFTRSEPSELAREQREALVADLHGRLLAALAEGRRLSRERAEALIAQGLFTPPRAQAAGLVDRVMRGEEVEEDLGRLLGARPRLVVPSSRPSRPRSWAPAAVAVVNIEGELLEGRSRSIPLVDMQIAGSQTLLRALDEAQRDPRVLAVVVRVESPGGSSMVADLLSRKVAELARHKPTVCSFGDTAASGGYYLAAPCSRIFTSATTVTGSIGIYGGKVDASQLLGRVGVRPTSYARGPHADMDQLYRPYSPEERELLETQLRHSYERFLDVVAAGRRLPRERVDAVARGRVWSGAAALQKGLCDAEGGLMDAVAAARRQAGAGEDEEIDLLYLPRRDRGLLGQLLDVLGLPLATGEALPGAARLGALLSGLRTGLLLLETPVLARMPEEPPR